WPVGNGPLSLSFKPVIKLHRTPAHIRMRGTRHLKLPPRIQGMRAPLGLDKKAIFSGHAFLCHITFMLAQMLGAFTARELEDRESAEKQGPCQRTLIQKRALR